MARYKIRKSGFPPKYDRAKIIQGIKDDKSNRVIAEEVGCTPGHVGDIRWEINRRRHRYCQ